MTDKSELLEYVFVTMKVKWIFWRFFVIVIFFCKILNHEVKFTY